MERRSIGSLDVSVAGLGCNNFGTRLDADATADVVDAALDAGIDFFDTADTYGDGRSEEFLGRALAARPDRPAAIATKFGWNEGARPAVVREAVEASLRRLGIERIDLYQLHKPDPTVPLADTLGALKELAAAGKIRQAGCSNFSVEQLRDAEAAARDVGFDFVSVQNEFSLLEREPEEAVLSECERTGMAFIPYFPLASGLLSGKYRKGRPLPEGTRLTGGWASARLTDRMLDTTERLARFAEERGHTLLELAFGWLLDHPPVASVIAGATHPDQARANAAAAAGWRLTPEEALAVDDLLAHESPG